jgi:glutamyl-tRNA reductase
MQQHIFLIGLNHKTAPVEVRERFALAECLADQSLHFPLSGLLQEVMVLSTCNRVEVLSVGPDPHLPDHVIDLWAQARGMAAEDLKPYVYVYEGLEAVRHIFCVATSLDSMVVGEPQITGQLKDAYRNAVAQRTTGVICNRLLHKAFSVAKRVRTETEIGSSAVSISYAAVELAKRIFGDMDGTRAMLVGAGEMAELAATHLLNAGISKVLVANRTFGRAQELARQFRGEPVLFEDLFNRLSDVDIVISSTGATSAIIRARDVKGVLKRRRNRPMFFIDIAVPRDVDPDVNNLDNVYLYDIDDLREVVEENLAQRQEEAARARAIVEAEVTEFEKWLKSLELQPTIVDMLDHADTLARRELTKTLKRLPGLDAKEREALETLAASIARKVLHEPITFLRRRAEEEDSARSYVDVARRMFNLDKGRAVPDAHPDRKQRSGDSTCPQPKPFKPPESE